MSLHLFGGTDMTAEATALINNLLRGVNFNNAETIRDAWRGLLAGGESSVPLVREKLKNPAWGKNPQKRLVDYFTVMLSLLGELDPRACKEEIQRLRGGKLHPVYDKIVGALSQRIRDEPATHIGSDVPVYIAKDIEERDFVIASLERWSRTPQLELDGVTRVSVVAQHPDLDYLGQYCLFFSGILLTWPSARVGLHRLWWQRFQAEFTFYHEVGHHACGHIEGGQVEEQEKEANRYARSMMRRSRPIFSRVMRVVAAGLRPLLRQLLKRLES